MLSVLIHYSIGLQTHQLTTEALVRKFCGFVVHLAIRINSENIEPNNMVDGILL